MKKISLSLILLSLVLFYSCEVPFNPNATFRQRYVLTGIMRNDTSTQAITLTKSYQTSTGLNPTSDTEDPALTNAEVNIWYGNTLYKLRDSVIARTDTSRYKDSVHFYYAENLKPVPGETMEIQAILPNGLLLQSTTQLPDVSGYDFFDNGNDIIVPPPDSRDYIYVLWKPLGEIYYQPRIMIDYYIKGSAQMQEHAVPLLYSDQNGSVTPIYPGHTKLNYLKISVATISKALSEIVPDNANISDYSIYRIDIQVIAYDNSLTAYYSSLKNSVDNFTVMVDPPDYSNIQGGYGIFGSYSRTDYYIKFNNKYLNSLGFK